MSAEGIKLESVLKIACKQLATGSGPKKFKRSKLPLTERQKELNVRSGGGEIFLDWLQSLPSNESNRAYFMKWIEDYDMARFGKLRKSKKKRAAFQFLSLWRNALIYDQEAARAGYPVRHTRISVPLRVGFLSPFVRALNALDAEFFADTPVCSNFLINMGHGDTSKLRPRNERLAFDEACCLQALAERGHKVRRVGEGRVAKEPDHLHRRLLRVCRERPHRCRAAERR